MQMSVMQIEPLQRLAPHVGQEHVGLGDELVGELSSVLVLQVDLDAALVAIGDEEIVIDRSRSGRLPGWMLKAR